MKSTIIIVCLLFAAIIRVQAQWSHVGPIKDNTPGNLFETGRLDCLCPDNGFDGINDQTIYAGSTSGGLWVTTDFCNTWNPVIIPDAVPFHGISALVADIGSNPSYMLVATENCGNVALQYDNIYQYFPATNTWIASDFNSISGVGSAHVNHIRVCPTNPGLVLAATSNGIYRSGDGGLNWFLSVSGNYENIDFVQVNANVNSNLYLVYACGDNNVVASTDLGVTFLTDLLFQSILSTPYYADLSVTFDASTPNKRYVYVDALNTGTSTHQIARLTIYKNGNQPTSVTSFGSLYDFAGSTDRMCTAAYDKVVYFGNGGLAKYNSNSGNGVSGFYSITNGVSDQLTSNVPYGNPGHADSHDVLMLPTLNKILYVNDGGFYVDTYNSTSTAGKYYNSWQQMNNNLNISQIWGMSCAEEDEDEYMTGEQDTKAFRTNSSTTTFYSGGVESSDVLIDKFDKNNYIQSTSTSLDIVQGSYDGTSFYSNGPYAPNATNGDICNATPSIFFPSAEFGSSTLWQDPNRPDKIYFGTKNTGLLEFCTTTQIFTAKKVFPESYQQFPTAIAFSRANKNNVYVTISSRNYNNVGGYTDLEEPAVYKFADADFDDSWLNHNDSWQDITPSFSQAPFTTPVSFPATCAIDFVNIAASDWNGDRIFVAIRYVPDNPQLKVLKYESGVWTDYSTGIPQEEIPISLVYEQGTNDQMYLGTNVNVYVRDASMSSWQLYSAKLPNLAMNQLRINYKENTVRVGTYGQGMWKSSLLCPANSTLSVTGTVTTDNFYQASSDITVQNHTVSAGDIKYRSGTAIDFLPDVLITSASNCTAFAFIHGCTGPGNTFRSVENDGNLITELPNASANEEEKAFPGISNQVEKIYPNPTNGILNIETDFLINEIIVYDFTGRVILREEKQESNKVSVSLEGQSAGIYMVQINGESNSITRKIILQ